MFQYTVERTSEGRPSDDNGGEPFLRAPSTGIKFGKGNPSGIALRQAPVEVSQRVIGPSTK